MNCIALLTGRGNNTLKDKNILDVLKKPVLYYPATAGRRAECITDWYVSSDDEKILSISADLGYKKIKRPLELALPTAQHYDVIMHALDVMEQNGEKADIVVCILANNVSIKSKWIDECVKMLQDDPTLTSVVPIYKEMDHHPLRSKKIGADGMLHTFVDMQGKPVSTNRQDLEPCYFLCHNFWAMRVDSALRCNDGEGPWSFLGKNVKGYIVNDEPVDIHDEFDLIRAAHWIETHADTEDNND